MEVSHNEHMNSHTMIGGTNTKTRGFGISESVITLLSTGIYANGMLAVVREVLCNAWDAHIAAGKTDVPVSVTIKDNTLTIRDFGSGIPDDKMAPIYCVYGDSTKVDDAFQTGGFGLGSKAPFAYTPHFTVVSHNQGKKIVYAITRGGVKTSGRPDLNIMTQTETDETGMEIRIPIKENRDFHKFNLMVSQIAYFGDMNVTINEVQLGKCGLSDVTTNYIILDKNEEMFSDYPLSNSNIFVRQGTVIYPVPDDEEYQETYTILTNLIANTSSSGDNFIILNSEANTIAMTPSRESLSMTELTKTTLKTIMSAIIKGIGEMKRMALKKLCKLIVEDAKSSKNYNYLLKGMSGLIRLSPEVYETVFKKIDPSTIDMVMRLISESRVVQNDQDKLYLSRSEVRTTMLTVAKVYDKENTDLYKAIIFNLDNPKYSKISKDVLVRAAFNESTLNKINDKLEDGDSEYLRLLDYYNYRSYDIYKITVPTKVDNLFDPFQISTSQNAFFKFLVPTKTIILAHSQKGVLDAVDTLVNYGNTKRGYSNLQYLVMLIPRKKGLAKRMWDTLSKLDYDIFDNTSFKIEVDKDHVPVKRGKGIVLVSSVTNPVNHKYIEGMLTSPDVQRTEKPICVFSLRSSKAYYEETRIDGLGKNSTLLITHFLPKAAVVSSSTTQSNQCIKYNCDTGNLALFKKIKEYTKKPGFLNYLNKHTLGKSSKNLKAISQISSIDPITGKLLKGMYSFTPKEAEISSEIISQASHYNTDYDFRIHINNLIDESVKQQKNSPVLQGIIENKLLSAIRLDSVLEELKKPTGTRNHDMIAMYHLALEG